MTSEADNGWRRNGLAERLVNVLTIVSTSRRGVSTTDVMNEMRNSYGDEACHRTIYRALEAWESCGYVRRMDPLFVGEPVHWTAMSKLVRNDA
jgi:Fe2+ or Zn2+ uptake regulation protein